MPRRHACTLIFAMGLFCQASLCCAADDSAASTLCPPQFQATACASGGAPEALNAVHAVDAFSASPVMTAADESAQNGHAVATPAHNTEMTPDQATVPPRPAAPAGQVRARELIRAWADAVQFSAPVAEPAPASKGSGWRQLPGLKALAQLRFHRGAVVFNDAGTQYFLKLRGAKAVRMGVNVAF